MTPSGLLPWGVAWNERERLLRQHGLGIETHGERLDQREILFVEEFLACGNYLEWLPRDTLRYKPTQDFRWLNHGSLESELKCNKPRLETITAAPLRAIYKAKRQGVVQENFMVCVGDIRIDDSVRLRLRTINARRTDRVAELWLMSSTGLERVPLA